MPKENDVEDGRIEKIAMKQTDSPIVGGGSAHDLLELCKALRGEGKGGELDAEFLSFFKPERHGTTTDKRSMLAEKAKVNRARVKRQKRGVFVGERMGTAVELCRGELEGIEHLILEKGSR